MGRDKLMLEVGGVPLVHRVRRALAARCAEVMVVGGAWPLPDTRSVLDERVGGYGPLAGIEAGLDAARYSLAFVAAGDLPFLPADLVGFLLRRLHERGSVAVVPRYGGQVHPLCAAYDRRILASVGPALDDGIRSVRDFLGRLDGVEYVEGSLRRFGDPGVFLTNVNTRQELELARRLCGGAN